MAANIRATIALDGEKEFKQAVTNANTALTTLKSTVSLTETQIQGQANTLESLQKKYNALSAAVEASKNKEQALQSALNNAKTNYDNLGDKLQDLNKQYEEAKKKLDEMKTSGKASTTEIDEQEKAVKELADTLELGNKNYQTAENRVNKWQTSLNKAQIETANMEKELEKTSQYMEEAQNSTDGCATSIDNFGNSTEKASQASMTLGDRLKTALTNKLVSTGIDVLKTGLSEVKEAITDIVTVGSEFEAAMSQVEALSGATGSNLDALTEKAKELGETTKYTATESAEALSYMALAGWDTQEMLNGIDGVLNLAAASDMDLATASDIVTDYLTAFGLSASDAGEFVDQMAYAMANSNTTTEDLGEAYKNCASTATSMGFSVSEVTAVLMTMANAGVKGGEAGTSLNTIMTRLATNTSGCADAISDYVQVYDDSTGEMNSLSSILEGLAQKWSTMTEEEQAATAKALAGTNQYSSLMTIMSGLSEEAEASGSSFSDYAEALENCSGTAEAMAETMQDNLQGSLTKMDSAIQGLQTELYEYIDGPLTTIVDGVTTVINGVTNALSDEETELESFISDVESSVETVEDLIAESQSIMDTSATDTADLEAYKNLLIELSDASELTTYQQYQLQNAIEALGDSIPELAEAFDEETGTLNLTSTELEELIDNYSALSEQESLLQAQATAQEALSKATLELAKADDALAEAEQEYQDTYGSSDAEKARDKALQAQRDANKAVEEAQEQYDAATAALDELGYTEEETTEATEALTEAEEELSETAEEVAASVEASAEAQAEACSSVWDAYNEMVEDIKADIADTIDLSEKFDSGEDTSVSDMMENLESQTEGLQTYKENLQTLISEMGSDLAPEFLQYIEDMGTDGAAIVQNMVDTLEKSDGKEQIKALSDEYVEAMDLSEDIAEIGATNQLAYEMMIGEFGSTEADFSALRDSIDTAVAEAADGWSGLSDVTLEALEDTIATAEAIGVQIPEGLADSIESGDVSVEEAISQMKGAIQGTFDGLVEIAEQNGIEIDDSLASAIEEGGDSAVLAMNTIISQLTTSASGTSTAIAEGISSGTGEVSTAATEVAESGAQSTSDTESSYKEAGAEAAEAVAEGIESKESAVVARARELATEALNGVKSNVSAFQTAGYNMSAGVATGISSGQSTAITAAQNMAKAALSAAKKELDINSPSKKFRTDVGQQISKGTAFGISDKASLASDEAAKMSSKVYSKATAWLTKYKKSHDVSLSDEKYYWNQVLKHCEEGTSAYEKALTKYSNAVAKIVKNSVSTTTTSGSGSSKKTVKKDSATYYSDIYDAAVDYMDKLQTTSDVSLDEQLAYWEAIQKQLKKGTDAWYDAQKEINSILEDYESSIVSAAETTMDHMQILNDVDTTDQITYWKEVRSQLTKYSDEWYEVTEKIKDLREQRTEEAEDANSELLSNAESTLSHIQSLNDMSVDAEIEYWTNVKSQLTKYSDEWYEVVDKISELKESYYDEMYEAAEDYADKQDTLDAWSLSEQLAYWEAVQKSVKKGTDAWYNAQSKINSIKSNIGTVSNMTSILSAYTTYYDLSAKAEMQYWETIRQQYEEGTDERLEADQKYLEAKEDYYEELEDLEEDYADAVKDIEEQLADDIEDLTDSYNDALDSRISELKDAFSLFDEFTSESEDGQTLLFNLQSQAAGYEAWSDALDALKSRGILSEDLLEELTEMGPEELAAIYALTDLTDEELTAYQEAYDKKMDAVTKQAKEDTADTLAAVQEQTEELKAQAEQDKADLLTEYQNNVASVNTTISSELLTLANSAQSIAEDQTTQLVAAISGGVSEIKAVFSASSSAASAAASTGTSTAASGVSSSTTSSSSVDSILEAIYSGPVTTTLTSAQRKKHHDLYLYLVDNYGHGGKTSVYKKLASLLGISISGDSVTSAEKTKILKKLKAKGYRSGGRSIEDELIWMDEELDTTGSEMIVRKSDNAILTRIRPGDDVIDADTTSNLIRLSKINPDDLMSVMSKQQTLVTSYMDEINAAGTAAQLNSLVEKGESAAQPILDLTRMEDTLNAVETLMSEFLPYLAADRNVYLDSDKLVGGIESKMSSALAARSRRQRM